MRSTKDSIRRSNYLRKSETCKVKGNGAMAKARLENDILASGVAFPLGVVVSGTTPILHTILPSLTLTLKTWCTNTVL